MTRKMVGWGLAALLAALLIGVGGAGGRSLATGTLLVQVRGDASVTATGGQINCGQGSKTCYFTTSSSATVILNASPSSTFDNWNGSDECSSFSSSPTCTVTLDPGDDEEEIANFIPPTPATSTLTAVVTGDASNNGGSVVGGDIDCSPGGNDCTSSVPPGSTLTLVAEPESGYDFTGWSGPCSGTAVSCTVSMGASDQTVHATFAKSASTQTLTVSVTGRGTVTGGGITCTSAGGSGCTASETTGSSVTLTATPEAGAGFTSWGGACSGSLSTCTLTMSTARSVTATFSGAGTSTVPLTVSVTGGGTVTGGGISCGVGATVCSADVAVGSSVTLTATPSSGSVFDGWGGACSGSSTTCTLTMSVARSVTATFTTAGPTGETTVLTLKVAGRGTVSATGGTCSSSGPERTCTQRYPPGTSVELSTAPAGGAKFVGWGGACSGTAQPCTVTMDTARTVTATFSGAAPPAGRVVLRSRGRPIVKRAEPGFAVTLRFSSTQRGRVRVRAMRAGRLETALAFTVAAGRATVGPFPVTKPGFYRFELALDGHALRWDACLGRCGKNAPGGPFALTRGPAAVAHAGAVWSVTVRFRATQPAGSELRIYRGKALARTYRFASGAGEVSAGPFLLSPATYRLRLRAIDAYGRIQTLLWYAFLP